MYRVICLSSVDYDWMFQRPQQLMRAMAREGREVIYCNKHQQPGRPLERREPNLSICHDLEALIAKNPWADVVWVVDPQYASWKGKFREKLFVYDCVDDFPFLVMHHHRMLKEADLIFTTAKGLYQSIFRYRKEVHLVPNGCDFEFFSQFNHRSPKPRVDHPAVIGYIGAIAPWVDLELIAAVAETYAQCEIRLVGASLGGSQVPKMENITYLGHQLYETLPEQLFQMDVVLIPFKRNTITRATNPIKLYEYLSQGKPIVSISLPELIPFKDCLYLAKTSQEFIDLIQEALEENNPYLRQLRIDVARNHSWMSRAEEIHYILLQALKGGGKR